MPPKTIMTNTVLVFFGFLVGLLVLELGVRTIRGALFDTTLLSAEYQTGTQTEPRAQYHPRVG